MQQSQREQTRGILIGPDAYRLIAEFIGCQIDKSLNERAQHLIVGAIRHVDDFYIGVRSESDASVVLSRLREVLLDYELQLNDPKTGILNGLSPIDDLWAQRLRGFGVEKWGELESDKVAYLLDSSYQMSKDMGSESPLKIALRKLDKAKVYKKDTWNIIEPKLQRIVQHFPHSIDYAVLLVAKRYAIGEDLDVDGWSEVISTLIAKHSSYSHHHEIVWCLWLLFTCGLKHSKDLIERTGKLENAHIRAIIIAAYGDGRCLYGPGINLGARLPSDDQNWLSAIVSRTSGVSKAPFGGSLAPEFEHLSDRNLRLIDFEKHIEAVRVNKVRAISRSRYGYDDDDDDVDFDIDDLEF
ncbi:RNA-directed DNA polymerase [Mesorhizobium sp. M0159]|uniref:RNA-directed DNA polymerase n=1 Tax=Mesorhizobium sp. M0159 TaxID=2956900 RepID=UPI0033351EC0